MMNLSTLPRPTRRAQWNTRVILTTDGVNTAYELPPVSTDEDAPKMLADLPPMSEDFKDKRYAAGMDIPGDTSGEGRHVYIMAGGRCTPVYEGWFEDRQQAQAWTVLHQSRCEPRHEYLITQELLQGAALNPVAGTMWLAMREGSTPETQFSMGRWKPARTRGSMVYGSD